MKRRVLLPGFLALVSSLFGIVPEAFAQYIHLDGEHTRALIVGHTVYLGNQYGTRIVFQKDGHLAVPNTHQVTGRYTISADGKICFEGGPGFTVAYSRGGGGAVGNCFRIVKSNGSYLGVDPDTFLQWVFVDIH